MKEEDKERLIFELYKDKPLNSSRVFRGKIQKKFNLIDTSDLYAKIINYQLKKYGYVLENGLSLNSLKKEDFEKKIKRNACRKYYSKTKDWQNIKRKIRKKEA